MFKINFGYLFFFWSYPCYLFFLIYFFWIIICTYHVLVISFLISWSRFGIKFTLILVLIKKSCSLGYFCACDTICLKCKEEFTNAHAHVNLINDNFKIAFELLFLLSILKKKFVMFIIFVFFWKNIWKEQVSHVMFDAKHEFQ
jgi:hypothetical protein